jgi:glucose-6-phosphate 1-epimerase
MKVKSMQMKIQEMVSRFSVPGVRFEMAHGGMIRIAIETAVSTGELYLHGAHVSRFQPAGCESVLWMSESSCFESDKPIRGGVSICFPWFGPHPSDAKVLDDGGVSLDLRTKSTDFELSFRVEFSKSLRMVLSVELCAGTIASRRFEEAYHTYLRIGDIRQVSISGLESMGYLDKVGVLAKRDASSEPIQFSQETDRVYNDTIANCVLDDPQLGRTITIRKAGSLSTVVWNPWIEKSARMPDFGDNEWTGMVCIETANVGNNSVELSPGQVHTMKTEIEVTPRKN